MKDNVNNISLLDLPSEVLHLIIENVYKADGLLSGLRGASVATRHSLIDVFAKDQGITEQNPAKIMEEAARRKRKYLQAAETSLKGEWKEDWRDFEKARLFGDNLLGALGLTCTRLLLCAALSGLLVGCFFAIVKGRGLLPAVSIGSWLLLGPFISSLCLMVGSGRSLVGYHESVARLNQFQTQLSALGQWEGPKCDFDVD